MKQAGRRPLRTCIGCGSEKETKELIRIVRTPEGEYHIDTGGKRNGRGAYICPDPACFEKALRQKALGRSFREPVSAETVEGLRKELSELGSG